MNAVEHALRGPAFSRILVRCGVDPKRYWLLVDLFHTISERGEMLDQLGRNGVALGTAAVLYAVMSAFLAIVSVLAKAPPAAYLAIFLFFTGFLITGILLSETGNSLVNPVEGMVLAHQPVAGGTYTAAKLSHLSRIVLWLTPALNGIPALAGLLLRGSRWYYPLQHMAAAFAVAFVCAMACCAAFGWLMRFVPAKRLKAAGQFAGAVPFVAVMWMGQLDKFFRGLHVERFVPSGNAARWTLAAAACAAAIAAVVFGIRALSADYLIRVSAMMRGGARRGAGSRPSIAAAAVARFLGGQPARAGFAFTGRLMLREWQFRRQFLATGAPLIIGVGAVFVQGWRRDPFAAEFSTMHLLPHAIGVLCILTSVLLPFGGDYKGAWVFQLAPPTSIERFAAGPCAVLAQVALWLNAIAAPVAVWRWGSAHALLFLAFSVAADAAYIAVALRVIDAIPFTRQPDPKRSQLTLPALFAGGLVIGLAVAIQHFLLFRSPFAVAAAIVILAIAGAIAIPASIRSLAGDMRNQIAEATGASGALYQEVDV